MDFDIFPDTKGGAKLLYQKFVISNKTIPNLRIKNTFRLDALNKIHNSCAYVAPTLFIIFPRLFDYLKWSSFVLLQYFVCYFSFDFIPTRNIQSGH